MADPIMDLFDDTPLFNLDPLPEETFTQSSSDPVEEALKLALGQVDHTLNATIDSGNQAFDGSSPALIQATTPADTPTVSTVPLQIQQIPQAVSVAAAPFSVQTIPQTSLPLAGTSSGSTAVLLSSPLALPVSGAQVTPQQLSAVTQQASRQTAPKIVILKGPQGQAQVLQSIPGTAGSPGKVTIARVLTGTPMKPGMSIVSGGAVLNAIQGQVKLGTGVQVMQTPNGPMKQVLLTSLPQTQTQVPKLQLQTQLQPGPVSVQTQVQEQAATTSGGTVAAQSQGVTLSTIQQQVNLSPHPYF